MTETNHFYFYGIIHNYYSPGKFLELKGIGLEIVSFDKISAIVAQKSYVDFNRTGKEMLAVLLVEHQKVLEEIMKLGFSILLPMKLGTWGKDKADVQTILQKGYAIFLENLEKVQDMVEVDVAVTWNNLNQIIPLLAEEPEIVAFKKELEKKGQITVNDQVEIGKLIREKLEQKSKTVREEIVKQLKPHYQELKQHELMNDQMVANIAFLVKKGKAHGIENTLNHLDADFNGTLNFKYVGPLPCYSFYTMEVISLNFMKIDQARIELGLGTKVAAKEIRQAYHAKVKMVHPDVSRVNNETYFAVLTKAYQLMCDYVKNFGNASDEAILDFSEEKVTENSLLIKTRR